MFKFRLFTPMGGNAGEVELAVPTVKPGEEITTGACRKLLVLDVAPIMDEASEFQALLTVKQLD
jgi:hypothetical protein